MYNTVFGIGLAILIIGFICLLFFATWAEKAAHQRKLHTVISHYSLNKWEYDYSSIIDPDDKSIMVDGKLVNVTGHHLYLIASPFPDVYKMPQNGSILVVKHKEDIDNISEMLPKTGIYKYPKNDPRMTPYVAAKIWVTDTFDWDTRDPEIIKSCLMNHAFNIINHPSYQIYRSMAGYKSDDYIYRVFEREIDSYLKYLEKNHYNKNDLKFYIISHMHNPDEDMYLSIIPDAKFVGLAEYYAAAKK